MTKPTAVKLWCGSAIAGVLLIATGATYYYYNCREGLVSHWNYERIQIGMTLARAEQILGPGKQIAEPPFIADYTRPPGNYMKPAVQGDAFWTWEGGYDQIVIGCKDGKVCDKWYKNWNYL